MNRFIKILFFALLVKPLVLFVIGLNVFNRHKLSMKGPAIIAANHNSHLDTIVLMGLYPLSQVHKVRPVAAADYFLKNKLLAWFALSVLGIIPIERSGSKSLDALFGSSKNALEQGNILILFPEGSRGKPEQMGTVKKGVFFLVNHVVQVPITPVILRGLGKALPKGEALFVPFNCDVIIGDELPQYEKSADFVKGINEVYAELSEYCLTRID